ncbi:MAG: hypothetical protein GY852_06745 [bacterium]|nr:hypothetical protein [bacterium]
MGVRPKLKEEKGGPRETGKETMGVPVKTELTKQQQLDYLTYLSLAALDVGLETGFKDGPMRDRGGVLSVTAQRIGAVKEGGKTPILKQEDAMYEVNYEAKSRAKRKGKGQMERKMRRLMRLLMAGKPPSPTSRRNYFSFGKGKSTEEAIALAKQAKAILEKAGFEVIHKSGTRGIHIVGFAKNAGSTVTSLQKYVRKKAMQEVAALRKRQHKGKATEREALMAKRVKVTKELFQDLESGKKVAYQSPPDPKFDADFRQKLKEMKPEQAAERILTIIAKPMTQDFDQYELQFLLKRKEVVETLNSYYPFTLFSPQEYRSYVSFMKGERRGRTATRRTGKEHKELLVYHKKERGRRGLGPVRPWDAIMENTQRLMDGKKAVFIRSSYSSAAQTIAELERLFPGRSVSYERSPESVVSGGGHWTITVAARGKRATPNIRWFQDNFGNQMRQGAASKDRRFTHAVRDSLAGGTSTVGFTNQNVPRWMSGMLDKKKSTQRTLVLKEEYWSKLQSKGIAVPKVIRGTPVYASERDKKKGREPQYYTFEFTLSGEKFSKHMEIARADVKKKYGPGRKGRPESGTAVARRKKRPAAEIKRLKKQAEDQFAKREKKGKKKA